MNERVRKNTRNLVIGGTLASAVAVGILESRNPNGGQPVDPVKVKNLAVETAKDIAEIPVDPQEIKAARRAIRELSPRGEAAVLHIDKATGQPYHIADSVNPRAVQVVRVIGAANQKGKYGTYEFTVNQELDAKGRLDPTQTSFIDVQSSTPDRKSFPGMSLYAAEALTPSGEGFTYDGGNWGGQINDSLTLAEMSTSTPEAEYFHRLVITGERLEAIGRFMGQMVTNASNHAATESYDFPESLVYKP